MSGEHLGNLLRQVSKASVGEIDGLSNRRNRRTHHSLSTRTGSDVRIRTYNRASRPSLRHS
jgi:hypothetical protein